MIALPKTVLVVGDEALYIYESAKELRLADAVPWGADNFEQTVATIIADECGGRPIVIINDMVEQHYRKERIPNVSIFDKSSIVKRKLSIAFPNYPVRAALPLKEKVNKGGKGMSQNLYIFAASPNTESFQKLITAIELSMATVSSLALLPIEAGDMIKTLSGKMVKKGQSKPAWNVFIGQHQSGGLRQIVVKNGELALTRMTPIIDANADPERWASEVHQEFQATLSYMARFGFDKGDGLSVFFIAGDEPGQYLQNILGQEQDGYYVLSVRETADKLGLNLSLEMDNHYADVLHAAWIAKKPLLTLPMQSEAVNEISNPRKYASFASIGFALLSVFLLYQLYSSYSSLSSNSEKLRNTEIELASVSTQYEEEIERKKSIGIDVRLMKASITLHETMENQDIKALKILKGIGKALGPDLRLNEVSMRQVSNNFDAALEQALQRYSGRDANNTTYQNNEEQLEPVYEATLKLSYPVTANVDRGNKEIADFAARLLETLPDHIVEVEKFLKDTAYVDEIVIGEEVDAKRLAQDFVAFISIRGTNT